MHGVRAVMFASDFQDGNLFTFSVNDEDLTLEMEVRQ